MPTRYSGDRSAIGELDAVGLRGLVIYETGFRDLSNNVREVKTPDDCKGLKIRVMESKLQVETWEMLGATPVSMQWNEAYIGMQQGAIDGQENPAHLAITNRVPEVNKYLTMTDHLYSTIFVMISPTTWNRLNSEDQAIFKDCALKSAEWQVKKAREMQANAIPELREKGMTVTTEFDKAAFVTKVLPLIEKYRKDETYRPLIEQIEQIK